MKKGVLSLFLFILLLQFLAGCTPTPTPITVISPKNVTKQLYDTLGHYVKSDLNSVSFVSPAKGVTVGDGGIILMTTNGGYNWNIIPRIDTRALRSVAMFTPLNTVAVGDGGKIELTTNGGASWYLVPNSDIQFLKTLRGVAFYSDHDGYAVGDSGVILYTNDRGFHWTKVYVGADPAQIYYGVSFNAANAPFAVGNKGNVTKLSISKWIESTITGKPDFYSVHFGLRAGPPLIHSDTGFIVGQGGAIVQTFDGGITWTPLASPTTQNLRSVFLPMTHWGYAVGDLGTVVRYDGRTWTLLQQPTNNILKGVDPTAWNPTSICVGENGIILSINPPPVNDGGSYVNVSGDAEDCIWSFELHTAKLLEEEPSFTEPYNYTHFEVCSSIEQSYFPGGPLTGWGHNEQFYSRSVSIVANTIYPSPGNPLDPLTLMTDPSGAPTSGYLTCYYIDQYGNPHLLSTYEIECSP